MPQRQQKRRTLKFRTRPLTREQRTARELAAIKNLLAGVSPPNRRDAAGFYDHKAAQHRAPATLRRIAHSLAALDRSTNATPWPQVTPDQLTQHVLTLSERLGQGSVEAHTVTIKSFYRWLHDSDELPKGFRRALSIGRKRQLPSKKPIEPDEYQALLSAAGNLRDQALLWTLWDTGMRVQEICSLNVGSLEPDGRGVAPLSTASTVGCVALQPSTPAHFFRDPKKRLLGFCVARPRPPFDVLFGQHLPECWLVQFRSRLEPYPLYLRVRRRSSQPAAALRASRPKDSL